MRFASLASALLVGLVIGCSGGGGGGAGGSSGGAGHAGGAGGSGVAGSSGVAGGGGAGTAGHAGSGAGIAGNGSGGAAGAGGTGPVPTGPLTTEGRIDQDLKAGVITDEQAFIYRVYAAFGSPSLPAKYDSGEVSVDSTVNREIPARLGTLSAAGFAAIKPYLLPPIYEGSWGDPALLKLAASSPAPSHAPAPGPGSSGSLLAAPGPFTACDDGALPALLPGWGRLQTEHFNIWYRISIDAGFPSNYYSTSDAAAAAANIASVVEEVYTKLTGLFGKVPLSDFGEPCDGGDGAIDIYVNRLDYRHAALTSIYPSGTECAARPAWLWIAPERALTSKDVHGIVAHELMHLIDFAYTRGSDCESYIWLGEAAGNWAVDYVYPDIQWEQSSVGLGSREIFAPCYYQYDYETPIEETTYNYSGCNGYSDYVFLFYLSRKIGPDAIKRVFEYAELYDPFDSLNNAISASGGLKKVWPDFATAGWNDWQGSVGDDFYKWDKLTQGRKLWFDAGDADPSAGVYAKSVKIELGGKREKTFEFADTYTFGTSQTIEPLSANYLYLKFTDDAARIVTFNNKPVTLPTDRSALTVRAIAKIGGKWQAPESWTDVPTKIFCRDAKAERLEELVVIYSNSNPARPRESSVIYLNGIIGHPGNETFLPTVDVSNVGCWRWEGTANLTTHGVGGEVTVVNAKATFAPDTLMGTLPDTGLSLGYQVQRALTGLVSFDISGLAGTPTCTIKGLAMTVDGLDNVSWIGSFALPDPLHRVVIASGSTSIDNVQETITCNGTAEVVPATEDLHWLSMPEEGAPIGDDGATIEGSWIRVDDDGMKMSDWSFRAMRE